MTEWISIPSRSVLLDPEQKVPTPVQPFEIARYPVSYGEFSQFVDATGYKTTAEAKGRKETWRKNKLRRGLISLRKATPPDRLPANYLSQTDATAYCEWAKVRLPTQAEWLAAVVQDWNTIYDVDFVELEQIKAKYAARSDVPLNVGGEVTSDLMDIADIPFRERLKLILVESPSEYSRLLEIKSAVMAVIRIGPGYVLNRKFKTDHAYRLTPPDTPHGLISMRVCRSVGKQDQ
jgi:hypothetical protein